MKKSILFPGQGSQYLGMGLDFYKNHKIAKQVFDEVDDALNISLSDIIFYENKGDINLTANTQPAIMATGVAIYRVLKEVKGIDINYFDFCAGHSLGEYTALVCSESLALKDAAVVLRARGEAMQNSVKAGEGAMAAILGAEIIEIEKIINENNLNTVQISNDNCPGQIVISGLQADIKKCCEEIKNKILKKNILLPVSAPFHCDLMKPASEKMKNLIMELDLKPPKIPIVTNVEASQTQDVKVIKTLLISQIYKKVRWREIIEYMFLNGVVEFIEIGPRNTLSGMLKRFKKNFKIISFSSIDDLIK